MARYTLRRLQGLPTEVVQGTGVWKTFTFGQASPGSDGDTPVPPTPPADAEAKPAEKS